jgi:hypothetical protein
MSNNYVIEIRPESVGQTIQAGLVVRDGPGFRFFAATQAFYSLERQIFKNPQAAADAALRHVSAPPARAARTSGIVASRPGSIAISQ